MSSNPSAQKNHKMCRSPTKNLTYQNNSKPTPKTLPELTTYEVLSTNCTMVGSNNLNLDSKIGSTYGVPSKMCPKPLKSPIDTQQNLLKKPQSPRGTQIDTYNNIPSGFGQVRGLQPSPVPSIAASFPKYDTFAGQSVIPGPRQIPSKPPTPGFASICSSPVPAGPQLNNGAPICSPSGYSNPSPSYPAGAASPYNVQISSPANSVSSINSGVAGIKSPVASPQNIRPPTPQPILPQAFQQIPVMTSGPNLVQIIHTPNNASTYQNHQMLARQTLIAPPAQTMQSPPPIIKIKPPLNILPKPPASAPVTTTSSKQSMSGGRGGVAVPQVSPLHAGAAGPTGPATQLMLPNQTILPAAQPLLLNQMPLIVQQNTAQGVQLILRPGTPNSAPQLAQSAAGKLGAPQNLILQQQATQAAGPQVLIQHAGGQRQTTLQPPQQLVRVLTANGMIQQLAPAYIAMNNQQLNIQQLTSSPHPKSQMVTTGPQLTLPPPPGMLPPGCLPTTLTPQQQQQQVQQSQQQVQQQTQQQLQQHSHLQHVQQVHNQQLQTGPTSVGVIVSTGGIEQLPPPKKKPKKKKKNTGKMDLMKIMKLSGIGDDDDLFESDASESAVPTEPIQPPIQKPPTKCEPSHITHQSVGTEPDLNFPKRIGNIHISAISQESCLKIPQPPTISSRAEAILSDKPTSVFGQSQISVQQSLSDINAINQNLTQIGLINQNAQNFISANNQLLSHLNANASQNIAASNLIAHQDNQNLANFLQALNSQSFPLLNGQNIQNVSASSSISVSNVPCLTSFANTSQAQTSNYQKFPANLLPSVQTSNTSFASSIMSNIVPVSQNITPDLPKSSGNQILSQSITKTNHTSTLLPNQTLQNIGQNISNAHFNISGSLPNIQVQNFCGNNPNLILNQGASGAILTPNIPNFSGNITINNNLIPNANLTLSNNLVPNFLPANLMQQAADVGSGFGNGGLQRTGGFKLALSEDGRLILQHDPNLNQDIQSQLLLQSIFGINLQGGNLVLTSVNNQTVSQPPKPITVNEPPKKLPELTNTKTTNIIQNSIPSIKTESQAIIPSDTNNTLSTPSQTPNNFSYIVNLTPDQLETLKRNGQLTVNGQTIFMHRQNMKNMQEPEKPIVKSSPKSTKNKKRTQYEPKNAKIALHDHLNIKNQISEQNIPLQPNRIVHTSQATSNQAINLLQSPNKNIMMAQQSVNTSVTNQQIVISGQITSQDPKILPTQNNDPNIICIPNPLKPQPPKINEPQIITQHLMSQKTNILKQNNGSEQLIILQQQNIESKQNVSVIPQNIITNEKKIVISNQDVPRKEPEVIFPTPVQNIVEKNQMVLNGNEQLNVEQFLSNLNISPANLGQLISQKLSQEIPGGVDHKIVNVGPGSTAGHIVAKIDISSENMQQILSGSVENNASSSSDSANIVMPPLVSMNVKQDEGFTAPTPPETGPTPLPALIIGNNILPTTTETTNSTPSNPVESNKQNNSTVYQRIQTIQLTPQKQQLLKSVQLQIQALTAKLQQKSSDSNKSTSDKNETSNISENDIHTALRLLFIEQQKILATGKIIPTLNQPISSLNCNMETNSTQSIPVTTASKNNNTFLTSLLQQPVVSHHQNQKVFYHHGNQIIAINPNWQPPNIHPSPTPGLTSPPPSSNSNTSKLKKCSPQQQTTTSTVPFLAPTKVSPAVVDRGVPVSPQPLVEVKSGPQTVVSPGKRSVVVGKPTYSKAQLIEQQLATDQNGAMNPDIITPFANKADACKRLVRYHCYNQPVLSQKDLNKADEIFELTARHFIEKFRTMVNKYKFLLFRESMREVQTSELMMIDRMFLAEEQQSFLKLQSDIKLHNELELQKTLEIQGTCKKEHQISEDNTAFEDIKPIPHIYSNESFSKKPTHPEHFVVKTEKVDEKPETCTTGNTDFNIKCGVNYFSDESCESGNYRVYGSSPREFDEFVGKSNECFTSNESRNRDRTTTAKNTGLESYNTTKIIGNFEIEINNKGCNSQESYTKNFRQKIIDGKSETSRSKNDENFAQKSSDVDDYDEWLCIQRELGYCPENNRSESEQKTTDSIPDSITGLNSSESRSVKLENEFKKTHKRTSTDSNRLETLKKFRVEKHNSKVKKTGSIIGEVKFEVRIEHKKVFTEQSKKGESSTDHNTKSQSAVKRTQCFDYQRCENEHGSKRACVSHAHRVNDITHQIKQEEEEEEAEEDLGGDDSEDSRKKSDESNNISDVSETFDRSIDEQVQSAIDSILNLQQIASMSERVDTQDKCSRARTESELATATYGSRIEEFSDPTDTLDEAVKSILS